MKGTCVAMLSFKKVVVVVVVSVSLFVGKEATPVAACSPQDGWTGCVQAVQTAVNGAVSGANSMADSYVQQWNTPLSSDPWTLNSGASAPLQSAYDAAINYARGYSK